MINSSIFGKIAPGMCRLSMNGEIAVKTSNGYKSYNLKKKRLTNCDRFVFDIGEDFFFCVPTNKVNIGDIILTGGKPKCVIGIEKDRFTVINYEDSTIDTILPEKHIFMGNFYIFTKIISVFGNNFKKDGMNNICKYMMMSEMMKGNNGSSGFGNMLPMMMLSGGNFGDIFDGMFDFDMDINNDNNDDDDDKEDEE